VRWTRYFSEAGTIFKLYEINILHIRDKWPLSQRHGASSGSEGRNGLEIWRVAANILNKQLRTTDNGWSARFGIGKVLTTPHRKHLNMLRITHTEAMEPDSSFVKIGTNSGLSWMR
jgi:hypothetical protein